MNNSNTLCEKSHKSKITKEIRERSKRALVATLSFFAGFAASSFTLPYGVESAGVASVFAFSSATPYCFMGCVAYSILYGDFIGFALCSLAVVARYFIGARLFCEKAGPRIYIASVIALFYSVSLIVISDFSYLACAEGITYMLSLPSLTYAFHVAASPLEKRFEYTAERYLFCLGITLFIASYTLCGLDVGVLNIGIFACALSGALLSRSYGAYGGAFFAALTFGACAVRMNSPAVFLSGLLSSGVGGLLRKSGKPVFLCAFLLSGLLPCLYGMKNDGFYTVLCSFFCAAVAFLPLCELVPKKAQMQEEIGISKSLGALSKAFSALSDTCYTVTDKLRYPSDAEIFDMSKGVCDSICHGCEMYSLCYGAKKNGKGVFDIICERLKLGSLETGDLPDAFAEECGRAEKIVDSLCQRYSDTVNESFRTRGTEILAREYSAMARLLKYTSQKKTYDKTPDETLTKAAHAAAAGTGIRFSSLSCYGKRNKTVDIYGVNPAQISFSGTSLASHISKACKMPFSQPVFIREKGKNVMRFCRKRRLSLEYSYSAYAKGGSTVNGDSVNFFESDEDYFYALISDGMGSGRQAALTSRLTSVFIEKLLTTGAHKTITLELLNNLLLSKNDESFATVDLLEVDLFTGESCFIKAGAAPAYIIRASKLYKIASATPPAGIIKSFCAESTRFTLREGDTVLMLSDGILQSFDEVPWLYGLVEGEAVKNPSRLAEKIVSKARSMTTREDDMTAAVITVKGAI